MRVPAWLEVNSKTLSKIGRLRDFGYTFDAIAADVGMDAQTVRRLFVRYQVRQTMTQRYVIRPAVRKLRSQIRQLQRMLEELGEYY